MKTVLKSLLGLSAIATAVTGQVINPVWYEHLNGQQGVGAANVLPILVKNQGGSEGYDPSESFFTEGTSSHTSFGHLIPYDSTRLLLNIRENGIKESVATPAQLALSAQYPDRSLIWINATNGAPWIPPGQTNAVAFIFGIHPIAITGQSAQDDFYSTFTMAADRTLYYGVRNKLLRYAYLGNDTWSSTPVCAWTEPTSGASDCEGNAKDGFASGGDGTQQSMRWREMRATGSGTNTVLFCGGGTWRSDTQPQVFITLDGTNFNPVARLDTRNNGAGVGANSLSGMSSSLLQYGFDATRPNLLTVYSGHYPGTGYGARPDRYTTDPGAPAYVIDPWDYGYGLTNGVTWFGSSTNGVAIMRQDEVATNGILAFNWEAAGKNGLPETVPIDGDQYYDGNWSCILEGNTSLDYVVNYSMPSWNNQYPSFNGTNYHKPGWIGIHRLDGTIAPNTGWKLQCTEADDATLENSPGGLTTLAQWEAQGVGSDWGYDGSLIVVPDSTAPANLKKATVYWTGSAYGFGVFTVQNVAAAITTEPPSTITVLEDAPLTISAVVSGSPNTYQWTKGGVALNGAVTNADGSFRYPATVIQGVTTPTLYLPQALVSDSGIYQLTINNPLSGATATITVNVTVQPDTNKPTILSVTGLSAQDQNGTGPNMVRVVFSKRIDPVTGGNTANYNIPGLAIEGVTLQSIEAAAFLHADWREAILWTADMTPGTKYSLSVSGVKDQTASANTIVPVAVPFVAPLPITGFISWDWFGPTALNLISANGVVTESPLTALDSDQITKGDLNNIPGYGSLGDNYEDMVSGWVVPTVTTNYVFFVASDDTSQLYLSSDAGASSATVIAQETSCCHGFQETNSASGSNPETVSASIPLVAGNRYYIRAVHQELGGGDYVKVAWRIDGDQTPAANLQPIPGKYLASYQPPQFLPVVHSGGQITLTWTGVGTLLQSSDLISWTPVAGNPGSPYTFTPGTGPQLYYRVQF